MNERVREAIDALRCLDRLERVTALMAVDPDVRTRALKTGRVRVMFWIPRELVMGKGKGAADKGAGRRTRRRVRGPRGGENDYGMPGGEEGIKG